MKSLKKYYIFILVIGILCVACACNDNSKPSPEPPVEQPVVEEKPENPDGTKTPEDRAKLLEQIAEVPQNSENDKGVIELKFRSTFSLDYLKSISGKKVKMTGYISTLSPISGEFAYLMNLPYQSCPYCVPGTTEIYNTITIVAKKNKKIDFTDVPVTVEGTLETGNFTDAFGYSYNVRINEVTVKEADATALSANVLKYNALSQEKIIDDTYMALTQLDELIFYDYYEAQYGISPDSIQSFDTGIINGIIDRINSISKTDYTDLISILESANRLATTANRNLEAGTLEENKKIQNSYEQVFMNFSTWMTKYEL